jgi:hypothetical protein
MLYFKGTSVLAACVWRPEAPGVPRQGISGSPTRNIRFTDKEYQVPRQVITGSPTRSIRFLTRNIRFPDKEYQVPNRGL